MIASVDIDRKMPDELVGKVAAFVESKSMLPIDPEGPAGEHSGYRVGVALSGGADSVALLAIGVELGWECIALHCNFGLRGEESERDERFARGVADQLGVDIIVKRFDVAERKAFAGESTEMACRELRYDWFREEYRRLGLSAVAIGHHRDDNIETFFLNLLRGSGLRGMSAIQPVRDIFIRPLLCCSRGEILDYLAARGLGHIIDSSNLSCEFRRNRIRNVVLPCFEREFPELRASVGRTVGNLSADRALLTDLVAQKSKIYSDALGCIRLDAMIAGESFPRELLFHILNMKDPGAFDMATVDKIVASAGESGRRFYGRNGAVWMLDRGRLILLAAIDSDQSEFTVEFGNMVGLPVKIDASVVDVAEFCPSRDPDALWLDKSALDGNAEFKLRHPRKGDRMVPFGMKRHKLLSDIFVNHKIPDNEKGNLWLLTRNGEVLWIVGVRQSACFPVTPSSEEVLLLRYRR